MVLALIILTVEKRQKHGDIIVISDFGLSVA